MPGLQEQLTRWHAWRDRSANRRIFAATVTVGGFTLLVKFAAMVKELFVARAFGTGDALDAYLIAFVLPAFAINVIARALNLAFMPTYIQVFEGDGAEAAQRLFSAILAWGTSLLLVCTGLLVVLGPGVLPLLGSGFSPEKLELTRSLFFLMLPILMLGGLAQLCSAVLNAGERFALASVVPVATPVLAVVLLVTVGDRWGIYALAAATLAGFGVELGLLTGGLRKRGLSLRPSFGGTDGALRQVRNQFLPMVASALLMSSTTLVDQAMAAMLEPGSVSALNYGNKVVALVVGISAMALGTAVLPHFSRMAAARDWVAVGHTLRSYVRLIVISAVPLTLAIIACSEVIVRLLFERGAFLASDTTLVASVQTMYALQVPFYILSILGVRLISSQNQNHVLAVLAAINLVLNVVGNYVLSYYLGVAGIALSTSVMYAVCSVLVFAYIHRTRRAG